MYSEKYVYICIVLLFNIEYMQEKLKNIAALQAGVYLKENPGKGESFGFWLSLRDFDDDLSYLHTAAKVDLKKVRKKYILTVKDLLFSTRQKFNAFLLPDADKQTYIASNSFAIIRPATELIRADYLYWYLNHSATQQRLDYIAQGQSQVNYISIEELGELKIQVPDMNTQKQIATLHFLQRRERELTNQIIEKKESYLQQLLINTAKHE